MNTYVALLRGINVGGNSKVAMSLLKKVFEGLDHSDVLTYINSGNVIFKSDEKDIQSLTKAIESAIEKEFGFQVRTTLRDKASITKLVQKIPKEWSNDTDQKTDVLFLWDEFDSKKSLDLLTKNPDVDTLLYIPGAIVWNINRSLYTKSGMHKFIGTTLYKHMTARNINTVRKLYELMQ
jgi:uncharacterized protein (DUF1697 family)